ncbi:cytidylyltransferase domain-containing protein [Sphingobacterium deserti]|uniref:Putative acylneuraminate cytidylyltransferase n=1 Tax=Sphingobacterium deserti TaxID=1229276 RepID=A0A0B8T0S1_9SPHI|nr:acylneuraminate cytidylyltransferase family protein [Sphingobacterium deserti]KGE14307.1 putative acylneuraminate cytidylyltransferase [Sphingobacterium deserti]
MTNKVSFFLPTRKGSQRVIDKNTRPFAGKDGGLLRHKLEQLLQMETVHEIVLSTNDEICIDIATSMQGNLEKLVIDNRPDHLCLDTTNLSDLIAYVPSVVTGDHIIWGHVTTPFADASVYDRGVTNYLDGLQQGFDSLVSVEKFRNFLLDEQGKVVNNTTPIPWPRTQDLQTLYEINHVMFITSKQIYQQEGNRLGAKPFLFEMDKMESFDVDWEEDFKVAELMYGHVQKV